MEGRHHTPHRQRGKKGESIEKNISVSWWLSISVSCCCCRSFQGGEDKDLYPPNVLSCGSAMSSSVFPSPRKAYKWVLSLPTGTQISTLRRTFRSLSWWGETVVSFLLEWLPSPVTVDSEQRVPSISPFPSIFIPRWSSPRFNTFVKQRIELT